MNSQVASPIAQPMDGVRVSTAAAPRQLVLERVGADFRPDTHLALGPWCFHDAEGVYPEWETLEFIDPFGTASERRSQNAATRGLASALLDELYPEMNRRHGTAYSREFWHLVLFNWLLHLVMLSWRTWRHVELFIARCGPEPLDVSLATAKRGFAFIDTNAFVQACYSRGSFRTWLIGEAVRLQAPAHWRLRTGVVLEPFETSRAAEPAPSGLLPITGINGVKWWQRLLLSLVIAVRPRKPACFGPLVAADVTSFPERYVQFASQLARETLPASFDHGFSRLDAEAKRQTYRPGRIRALTVNMHDDRINILLAHAVRAGERIVAVQHGGAYGTAALLASAPDLEYCHDRFITWGWTGQEDYRGRFVPLPSPLLARIAGAPRTPSQAIMFVGTLMLAFNPRFDYCADALEYRHWKRRFVTVLSTDAFANLRYRPYFSGNSLDDAAWLHRFFPGLPIADGDLQTALRSCRLVVIDYPGTTLAEALAANIPTICFWDKEQWLLSRRAQPLFDKLADAGILFDRPEDAAAQLNAIFPDIEAWWQAPERQSARAEWCSSYARTERHWFPKWLSAFATI